MLAQKNDLIADDTTSYYQCLRSDSSETGKALYADEDIPKSAKVILLTGNLKHRQHFDANDYSLYALQVDEDMFLIGVGNDDDYINHSCAPNLATNGEGLWLYALKDIKKGEELTFDYCCFENDPNWSMECLCHSPECRGKVTAFQNFTKVEQKSMLPYARKYLKSWFQKRYSND